MDVMTKQSSKVEAMSLNSSDDIPSDDDMDMMEMASSSDEDDDIERDPNNQTMTEKIGEKLEMDQGGSEENSDAEKEESMDHGEMEFDMGDEVEG